MRYRNFVLVAAGLLASGCMSATGIQDGNKPVTGDPQVKTVSSTPMSGEAGVTLSEPVRVLVVDDKQAPLAGETVTFQVTAGGGSVNPATATTDAAGIASTQWLLGPTPGVNTLKASRGSSSVTLTATGTEALGAAILKVSGGTTDSLPAGCALLEPFTVQVTDKTGKPVQGATVDFQVATGDGTVSTPSAVTGSDGMTSATFRVGFTGGANVVRAVLRTAAKPSVEFSARSAPAAPNGFSVMGNKIYDPGTCKPVLFHGAARPALESWYNADDQFAQFSQQAALMKNWGANVIRIPVSQSYWVTGTYWNKQALQAGIDYKAKVVATVAQARAAGLSVILDLETSDRGDMNYSAVPNIWKMPDAISKTFWADAAATFKNDGGVMFELYTEPHPREDIWTNGALDPLAWQLWRNGGTVDAGPDYPCDTCTVLPAYRGAGMQELYDIVRNAGARNLVIVNGSHWGYTLDGVSQYALAGYNIVYGTHPYDYPEKQPSHFAADFGFLAAKYPVMISEFGQYTCQANPSADTMGPGYTKALLDYADQNPNPMSWVAWAFWTPNPIPGQTAQQRLDQLCATSALLSDWNGTPSAAGQVIKARLATYR